ncbi:MAG: NYN domain-containing protein [Ignavibacteria bacterium]|nr:NYN domain-containing protein [Ignavibacteria bacterium]
MGKFLISEDKVIHYIVDGNNLIGKIPDLQRLKSSNPQGSREGLIRVLDVYFREKKNRVSVFFDGFEKDPIALSRFKIHYSNLHEADSLIRKFIEHSTNPKLLCVVTSDLALLNFARKCSCTVIPSEEFVVQMKMARASDDEAMKIHDLSSEAQRFIKLFGEE